jgi:hypothetical protein
LSNFHLMSFAIYFFSILAAQDMFARSHTGWYHVISTSTWTNTWPNLTHGSCMIMLTLDITWCLLPIPRKSRRKLWGLHKLRSARTFSCIVHLPSSLALNINWRHREMMGDGHTWNSRDQPWPIGPWAICCRASFFGALHEQRSHRWWQRLGMSVNHSFLHSKKTPPPKRCRPCRPKISMDLPWESLAPIV